jgi:hypothetical protein
VGRAVGMEDTPKKKNAFLLIKVFTYVQLILWLHWLEAVTYAIAYNNWVTKTIFFILTVGIILLIIGYFRTSGKKSKIVLCTVLGIIAINIFFGSIVNYISNYKVAYFTREEANRISFIIYENGRIPAPYKILYKDRKKYIYIIGKERSKLKKYAGIVSPVIIKDKDSPIDDIIPRDFAAYAALFDPRKDIPGYKKSLRDADFLSWQFPEYIFLVITLHYDRDLELFSPGLLMYDESTHLSNRGIFQVEPLLNELFGIKIFNRLHSYMNVITYTFMSPHYRTDLVNDPYFLLLKGKIKEAKEKIAQLPEKRKSFLVEKMKQ